MGSAEHKSGTGNGSDCAMISAARHKASVGPSFMTRLSILLVAAFTFLPGCERAEPPEPEAAPPPVIDVNQVRAQAEQGNPEAQKTLGDAYASGGNVRQDFKQAVEWYQKGAAQGHPGAQNSLGELCEAGQGMPASDLEAAAWYRKAAEQGHVNAQYNLAVLYAFGRGVKLDETEAVKWYRKAAEQGNALAQFNLGQRCQLGKGVTVDLPEAYKWLSLAAKTIPDSAKILAEVKRGMTREQIGEGRRRAAAFQPAAQLQR